MADTKISALSALSSANITATDAIPIVDDMSGTPATYRGSVNDLRGSWEFIASVEETDEPSLDIGDIPTGFDLHRLTIPWMTFETDSVYPILRLSDDNGTTFETTSYNGIGGAPTAAARLYVNANSTYLSGINLSHRSSYLLGNDTGEGAKFTLEILNLTNAAYTVAQGGGLGHNTDGTIRMIGTMGVHESAVAMDAIQLISSSDNISGKMVLEGYRY